MELNLEVGIFINEEYNNSFLKDGYCKINGSFLNSAEIKTVLDWFHGSDLDKKSESSQYHVINSPNKNELSHISSKLEKFIKPKLETVINEPVIIFGTFVIKFPDSKGILHLHQDGSLLDEDEDNISLTCWIPLVDVDMRNGCLGFIKNSNHIYNSVRPAPFPATYVPLKKHAFSLLPYVNFVPMKAGEMVVFDSKTFHGGFPNFTNQTRYVLTFWITTHKSNLVFYYLKPGTKDKILKYKIDKDFFTKYDNALLYEMYTQNKKIEDYTIVDELVYNPENISKFQMINMVRKSNRFNQSIYKFAMKHFPNEMRKEVITKIFSYF